MSRGMGKVLMLAVLGTIAFCNSHVLLARRSTLWHRHRKKTQLPPVSSASLSPEQGTRAAPQQRDKKQIRALWPHCFLLSAQIFLLATCIASLTSEIASDAKPTVIRPPLLRLSFVVVG